MSHLGVGSQWVFRPTRHHVTPEWSRDDLAYPVLSYPFIGLGNPAEHTVRIETTTKP